MIKEIELKNGARMRVRPVPRHVFELFRVKVNAGLPQKPEPPTINVQMAAGHSEEMPAGEESPEWEEYQRALNEYDRARTVALTQSNSDYNTLLRDYCIVEWSFNGSVWLTDVPEGWVWDSALTRAHLVPSDNPRVDYICLELLTSTRDLATVNEIAESNLFDITDEEVSAASAGFRAGGGQERDAATKKRGWLRRLAFAFSRGNDSG